MPETGNNVCYSNMIQVLVCVTDEYEKEANSELLWASHE